MRLFHRAVYYSYRFSSSLRYWSERRFTRAGLWVLGAAFAGMIFGADIENSVGYQGLVLLVLLIALAVACSPFFRGRFAATRLLPRFGTAGHPLRYRVLVRNLGRKPQAGLTLLETLADPRPTFAQWLAALRSDRRTARSFRISRARRRQRFKLATMKDSAVPPLPPGHEAEVTVELLPERRGLLRFESVTLARPDPFGIFRGFVRVRAPQTALILPRRYSLPDLPLPGAMRYQQGGVALASNVGRSDEFVALRDYRRGDPIRHIHWRTWARAGKPVVKEFEDEFFVRHALVLDTFIDHPSSQAFEEAVSVAASFACRIQTQESLLDLLFVGPQSFCFTSGRGLAHTEQMLEVLASVQPCSEHPFASLRSLVLNHARLMSGCICVFLAWNTERQELVRQLRLLGVPVLALVVVEPGSAKEIKPGPLRDEPDAFRVIEVGKVEEGLARIPQS